METYRSYLTWPGKEMVHFQAQDTIWAYLGGVMWPTVLTQLGSISLIRCVSF